MSEKVCQFGPGNKLVGVLTEPLKEDESSISPGVVMLNAGLLHHVGPHRMYVELSRQLADSGISSLRFDMGGYGDSDVSTEVKSDDARIFSDIKSALDFLEQERGIHNFVLFGTCSGADNSHAVALRDSRVVGAILLDGFGYWTLRSYIHHYLPRVFKPSTWLNMVRRIFIRSAPLSEERPSFRWQLRRPFVPRLEVRGEIQSLVDRGMQMLYVYTGGVEDYYNYPNQFFDMFRGLKSRGKIEVEYFPYADHTYTFAEDRERMIARVIRWYSSRSWGKN